METSKYCLYSRPFRIWNSCLFGKAIIHFTWNINAVFFQDDPSILLFGTVALSLLCNSFLQKHLFPLGKLYRSHYDNPPYCSFETGNQCSPPPTPRQSHHLFLHTQIFFLSIENRRFLSIESQEISLHREPRDFFCDTKSTYFFGKSQSFS